MKSPTVQSSFSVIVYRDVPFDEAILREIVQVHQVPDIVWLGEQQDVAVRVRDPLPAEVKWLGLAPGAMVAITATAPGVVFAYFAGAAEESELVAVVVQYRPDSPHLMN